MAFITPLPHDDLDDDLKVMIADLRDKQVLSTDYQARIWAHRPEAAKAWLALLDALNTGSTLDGRLRELVRLKIASITNCSACQTARKSSDVTEEDIACLTWSDPRFTPAEQAALRYAELYAADYFSIDESIYDGLRAHFTTAQIVDLNMFAAMMLAGGRMTYVQQAYEMG